jgi:hypothetical protein
MGRMRPMGLMGGSIEVGGTDFDGTWPLRGGGSPHPGGSIAVGRAGAVEGSEDGAGGAAFFDKVFGELEDFFEGGEGVLAGAVVGFVAAVVDVGGDVGLGGPGLELELVEEVGIF